MLRLHISFSFVLTGFFWAIPSISLAQTPEIVTANVESETRGLSANAGQFRYSQQFAIIVGIDYANRNEKEKGPSILPGAVNDARAIRDVLIERYGYKEENVFLLDDAEKATKSSLEPKLVDLLGDKTKVKEDSSVLFYFAGHGTGFSTALDGQTGKGVGLLLPSDVRLDNAGDPIRSTCIDVRVLLQNLEDCPARHKLVLLDCCKSGLVLQAVGQRGGAESWIPQDQFEGRVTVAITAGNSIQDVPDQSDFLAGHSPFTGAILTVLRSHTETDDANLRPLSAYALWEAAYRKITAFNRERKKSLPKPLIGRSSPDADKGFADFFFIPTKSFKPSAKPATSLADTPELILQTLPGLTGNWWFAEFPALTPRMRLAIADELPTIHKAGFRGVGQSGTFLVSPDVKEVYKTLKQTIEPRPEWVDFAALSDPEWPTKGAADRKQDLTGMLQSLESNTKQDAVTLHTSALFRQELQRINGTPDDSVAALYSQAIKLYDEEVASDTKQAAKKRGLLALCRADFARYRALTGDASGAIREFRLGLRVFGNEPPPTLFLIDLLCAQADSSRAVGQWKTAADCLEEARASVDKLADDHPLKAYVYERIAWNHMDRWRARAAETYFGEAARFRSRQLGTKGEDKIAMFFTFWDRHGVAMAKRFQGRNAAEEYATLNLDIKEAINSPTNSDRDRLDFYDRRVNTLERSADACIFGSDPRRLARALLKPNDDPGVAADRAALKEAVNLLEAARVDARVLRSKLTVSALAKLEFRLRCKKAIAVALQGELEKAANELTRAEDCERNIGGDALDDHVRIVKQAAYGCLESARALRNPTLATEEPGKLRELARAHSTAERLESLNRDDLELLMYSSALLLSAEAAVTPPTVNGSDLQAFTTYVRHARELSENESLAYLRRYFDIAIESGLRQTDISADELVDIVMEARYGTKVRIALPKTRDARSTLLFHFMQTSGLALYSSDGGAWQVFELPFGCDCLQDKEKWRLPETFRETLAALPRPVETWYCDDHNKVTRDTYAWEIPGLRLVD